MNEAVVHWQALDWMATNGLVERDAAMRLHSGKANKRIAVEQNVGDLIMQPARDDSTARERRQATQTLLEARCWCGNGPKWITREAMRAGVTSPCRRRDCVKLHGRNVDRLRHG